MLLNIVAYLLVSHFALTFFSRIQIPSPGIYAVTSLPLLNRTFAVLRSPEFGFFGFVMPTRIHTPFISGRYAS